MSVDELQAQLHEAAARLGDDPDGVYEEVIRQAGRRKTLRRAGVAAPAIVLIVAFAFALSHLTGHTSGGLAITAGAPKTSQFRPPTHAREVR